MGGGTSSEHSCIRMIGGHALSRYVDAGLLGNSLIDYIWVLLPCAEGSRCECR